MLHALHCVRPTGSKSMPTTLLSVTVSLPISTSASVSVPVVSFLLIMYGDSSLNLTNDKNRICAKHAINAHINMCIKQTEILSKTQQHARHTQPNRRTCQLSHKQRQPKNKNKKTKREKHNGTQEAARDSDWARSSKMQMRRELRPMRQTLAYTNVQGVRRATPWQPSAAMRSMVRWSD